MWDPLERRRKEKNVRQARRDPGSPFFRKKEIGNRKGVPHPGVHRLDFVEEGKEEMVTGRKNNPIARAEDRRPSPEEGMRGSKGGPRSPPVMENVGNGRQEELTFHDFSWFHAIHQVRKDPLFRALREKEIKETRKVRT